MTISGPPETPAPGHHGQLKSERRIGMAAMLKLQHNLIENMAIVAADVSTIRPTKAGISSILGRHERTKRSMSDSGTSFGVSTTTSTTRVLHPILCACCPCWDDDTQITLDVEEASLVR
jgi:hypothetical protein